MSSTFVHKKISTSLIWWILAIVVNLALALVMVKYFFTIEQANLLTSATLSGQNTVGWPMAINQNVISRRPAAIEYNEAASLQPGLSRSLVKIFKKSDLVAPASMKLDNLYNLDRPLASGWVVTSDGWVISSADLDKWSDLVVVAGNRKVYQINQKTTDPLTGLFFYRLTGAANLAPIKLGEVGWSRPGQLMYNLNGLGDLKATWLESVTDGYEDNVMNSDVLWRRWKFSVVWTDSAIFSGQGDLFGIIDRQNKIIPANYIKSGLNSLLSQGNFKRVSLGLEYLDLNRFSTERSGLLVSRIAIGSSAEKAGLKTGDILLSIDEINFDGEISLNEILQGYHFGDRANLIIQRAGQNRQLNCQF
ncbi:PDZ domain-containing protein [Candidatus Falkowbacteria bacterium]|nr:PDZ domain-containing protein [Candidatus Falkowbacteria bacterium]